MRKFLLSLILLIFVSNSSYGSNDYKSIEEVKSLNYELFEEIGLDENKINYVSRVIYSTYKKAQYMTSNGASPQKAVTLDKEADEMLLKVLSQSELKKFNSIKHKLK
jgi:HSP90 family molecular chaperone